MFYEEIRIKQGLSYISFCPLRILYNNKLILMATSLGTNAVKVTRVHCTYIHLEKLLLKNFNIQMQTLMPATGLPVLLYWQIKN